MIAELTKANSIYMIIFQIERSSYVPLKAVIVKAIVAEVRINVAVLLDATSLSMPALNQIGIRIGPPPIPRVDPMTPANKPAIIYLLMLDEEREI